MVLNVDQVYFFGDSITDTGNVLNFTGGFFPGPPVFELGRFSNGDVWTDYFTEEFNLTVDPFIDSFNPETFEITFNLNDTNDGTNFAIGDDLYFIWAGANDYLSLIENADDPATADVIEVEGNFPKKNKNLLFEVVNINIGGAIQDLIDAGGKDIVVLKPNLD